jgi:1-deoxy-D-xylulose-5-phosphate synthase
VLTPADENECRQLLTTAYQHEGTAAVRYPRGSGPGTPLQSGLATLPWGKGEIRRQGKKLALLAFGTVLQAALQAGEVLGATVANMRFVKPLDTDLLTQLAQSHDYLVTIEEGVVMGGAGSAVLEYLSRAGWSRPVLTLGLPDEFVDHGDQVLLMKQLGLDADGILEVIQRRWPQV